MLNVTHNLHLLLLFCYLNIYKDNHYQISQKKNTKKEFLSLFFFKSTEVFILRRISGFLIKKKEENGIDIDHSTANSICSLFEIFVFVLNVWVARFFEKFLEGIFGEFSLIFEFECQKTQRQRFLVEFRVILKWSS